MLEMAARIAPEVAATLDAVIGGAVVLGGIAALDGDIARCMVLCEGGFLLLEVSRSGDQLSVAVPVWRIRRVAESRVGGLSRVQVELDADRAIMAPQPDGTTVVLSSSYEVALPTGVDQEVQAFAALMRTALLGAESPRE
jgi:hypothetical protein